jgi:2Fe-2S ferredoxin
MSLAVQNGVDGVVGQCGGMVSCATCHVYVHEDDLGRLAEIDDIEDEMLDATVSERTAHSRLGCQIELSDELGDLRVTMPEGQL